MREIKFRVWLELRGEMAALTDIHLPCATETGGGPIMQYTGLHDKNGKEIYEGDIVRRENDAICRISFYDDIGFDSAHGKASGFYFNDELEYYDDGPSSWEVIGNIYENPELLK